MGREASRVEELECGVPQVVSLALLVRRLSHLRRVSRADEQGFETEVECVQGSVNAWSLFGVPSPPEAHLKHHCFAVFRPHDHTGLDPLHPAGVHMWRVHKKVLCCHRDEGDQYFDASAGSLDYVSSMLLSSIPLCHFCTGPRTFLAAQSGFRSGVVLVMISPSRGALR